MILRFALGMISSLIIGSAGAQVPMTGAGLGTPRTSAVTAITTPILSLGGSVTAPSTSTTQYQRMIVAENAAWGSATAGIAFPMPIPGTFEGLVAYAPSTSAWTGAGTDTFSLNASASTGTALSCVMNSTNGNVCSDTTNATHVLAGATVAWSSTPASTPSYTNTTPAPFLVSGVFVGDNNQESPVFLGAGTLSATALNYFGSGTLGATENVVSVIMPTAGTLDSLYVVLSGTPGTNASYNFTVFKNGQAQTVVAGNGTTTCAGTGGGATACQDTAGCTAGALTCTHSVAVVAGDSISIQSCPSTSGNTLSCPAVAGTPAAATARSANAGLRFTPTTTNQTVILGVPFTFPAVASNAVRYNLANGSGASDTTNVNELNVLPYTTGVTQTYANSINAYCWSGTNTAGAAHTVIMEASAGSSTITTGSISTLTVGCPAAGTNWISASPVAATQGTGSYVSANPVVPGSTIDLKNTQSATAGTAYTTWKHSMTVVVH